jgi:hypothetical protein
VSVAAIEHQAVMARLNTILGELEQGRLRRIEQLLELIALTLVLGNDVSRDRWLERKKELAYELLGAPK